MTYAFAQRWSSTWKLGRSGSIEPEVRTNKRGHVYLDTFQRSMAISTVFCECLSIS